MIITRITAIPVMSYFGLIFSKDRIEYAEDTEVGQKIATVVIIFLKSRA
jgi:hypothetical protein